MKQAWVDIVEGVLLKSGSHGLHLALVLSGVKPGDWIENYVYHTKWVIGQIEQLIKLGAPLAFLDPKEVLRVKGLQFEDISKVFARNNKTEIKHALSNPLQIVVKYHFSGISREDLRAIREDLSTASLGRYFGYPDCCITAAINGPPKPIYPYTEHMWCSPACPRSLALQELYKRTLHQLIPWLPEITNQLNYCVSAVK